MPRHKMRAAALVAGLACLAPSARAADKVALLIGNGGYPGESGKAAWRRLDNAAKDVKLIGETLRKLGFEVHVPSGGSKDEISDAVRAYGSIAVGAKISVVYYAGHGFEYGRRNYLVPTNAPMRTESTRIADDFIDLEQMANMVANADANIFFIDACRDGSVAVELVEAKPQPGANYIGDIDFDAGRQVIVVYSTARGKAALDAAPPPSDNSPFALAVAEVARLPRYDINRIPSAVKYAVGQKTQGYPPPQEPYPYGAVRPDQFFFNEGGPGPGAGDAASPAALSLGEDELATIDAPLLATRVLLKHSPLELEQRARKGDTKAIFVLSYLYASGTGVKRDPAAARAWMEKPAALATWYGKLRLADFLDHERASEADRKKALALYRAAAKSQVGKAVGQYAYVLMAGRLVPHTMANYNEGLAQTRRAAELGYPYAMYAVANTDKEDAQGAQTRRLRALALAGSASAREWVCDLAARRGDHVEALRECTLAAEAGSAIAQARLAIAYHDGIGVAVSTDDARHWTRLALAQDWNHPELQQKLKSFGYSFVRRVVGQFELLGRRPFARIISTTLQTSSRTASPTLSGTMGLKLDSVPSVELTTAPFGAYSVLVRISRSSHLISV